MRTIALLCIAFFSLGLLAEAQLSKYNRLVWQDEFNGNSLDRAKWQYEDHCSPQNQELQCYTPRTDNVYVRDGNLHVKALVENRGNKKYTSGRINTRHAAAWKYGRFEVRAKLPKGDYLWPAFWMLPRDYVYGGWAASGEIDIMEYRGQNTNQISNALHYGGAWPNNAHVGSGRINFPFDFSADYHTFTTVWERDNIYWYVDGKQVATRNLNRSWYSGRGNNPYTANRQPFDQPFFFLINMAIGGNFFGAQSQALTTAIANRWENPVMQVDWVRVYAEGAEVNPNPVPVPQNSTRAQTSQAPPKTSQAPPKTSQAPPKTSDTKPTVTENVRSTGISTAASSAASSAVSTAATSGATSAESSAGSTFYYSEPERSSASNEVPTPTSSEDSNACPNGCGAGSCCDDQGLGGVCFDSNYVCATDEANGKKSLCGKGLGACNTVCYDKMMYNCVSGTLRLA